jgi:hypothetical protein
MGKGHYPHSHTEITIGPDGTRWPSEIARGFEEHYDRWSTHDNASINLGVIEHKRQRKEFTYFMLACAQGLLDSTLSALFPPAPSWLREQIRRAGGNIKWLNLDEGRHEVLKRAIAVKLQGVSGQKTPMG